jgi:hydroxymethylpyrimidine pyrophosphatase-like HAD family hydrolase
LIDENYQLTDPTVIDAIRQKKQEGWQVGMTSDTPMPTLYRWWKELDMNGPLVLEKGAAVWFPEDDATIKLTKAHSIVERAKPAIISSILKMDHTMLVCGDSVSFIRGVHVIPGCSSSTLVAFNGLRQFSIAFHVRRIEKETGRLVLDVALAQNVIERLRDHLPVSDLISDGEFDPDYAFFYMNPLDVDKTIGAHHVFEVCKAERKVVIGDSMSDQVINHGVEVLAVGNASNDFKKVASRVATRSYASGVKELLESL